ncbi:MAG: hypothetical protein ABR610_04870, partial [Thermoanaerobaculia bacterium]
ALPAFAAVLFQCGDVNGAVDMLTEASILAVGNPIAEGAVYMFIAEHELNLGNPAKAVSWCRGAVEKLASVGASAHLAYIRVWLAEALIRADSVEEARQELLSALPILKAENMIVESAQAAKLLAEIRSIFRHRLSVGLKTDLF